MDKAPVAVSIPAFFATDLACGAVLAHIAWRIAKNIGSVVRANGIGRAK